MWDFFEQPWTLLGAAVLVLLGVLTFRSVWSERSKWWQWLLPLGTAALALGLDFGVATDLEKINGIIRTGIRAAEQEDCVTIARLIAPDYADSFHKSKQALMARCRERLVPPAVEQIRKLDVIVEISPPRATATFTMLMKFDKDSYWASTYKQYALVKMQFHLRKQPDKSWLIQQAEVLEVDKTAVNWRVAKNAGGSLHGTRPGGAGRRDSRLPVRRIVAGAIQDQASQG